MARGLGLESCDGDGNDVESVYQITADAVNRLRRGNGPQFLEFYTYRHREHCGPNFDNDIGYRSEEEFQEWKGRDPIVRYEAGLLNDGAISRALIDDFETRIAAEVAEAFAFAEASPFPNAADAFINIYAKSGS
jgi:pyruvate dehydrogenase E1 component alpha subunit